VSGGEVQSKRRAHLNQDREEQHQPPRDFACLKSQDARQHGRLIVGFTARTLILETAAVASLQDLLDCQRRAGPSVKQMNTMPGWKLHPLKGSRAGTYAVAVSGIWRLTFWIKDNEIFDLELEDYH
jgi:plasmid maintenance system killer protein